MFIKYPEFGAPEWKAPVPTIGDLPATGNNPGDIRLVDATGQIFYWNGTTWVPVSGLPVPTFTVFQPDTGTSPTATTPGETVTFTGTNGISVLGDAGTDTITIEGRSNTRVRYITTGWNSNAGAYRTRQWSSTTSSNFSFYVPDEAVSVVSIGMIAINQNVSGVQNISLTSNFAAVGENFQTNVQTNPGFTFDFTTNAPPLNLFTLPLDSVFVGVQPGDYCGVTLSSQPVGSTYRALFIRLEYTIA